MQGTGKTIGLHKPWYSLLGRGGRGSRNLNHTPTRKDNLWRGDTLISGRWTLALTVSDRVVWIWLSAIVCALIMLPVLHVVDTHTTQQRMQHYIHMAHAGQKGQIYCKCTVNNVHLQYIYCKCTVNAMCLANEKNRQMHSPRLTHMSKQQTPFQRRQRGAGAAVQPARTAGGTTSAPRGPRPAAAAGGTPRRRAAGPAHAGASQQTPPHPTEFFCHHTTKVQTSSFGGEGVSPPPGSLTPADGTGMARRLHEVRLVRGRQGGSVGGRLRQVGGPDSLSEPPSGGGALFPRPRLGQSAQSWASASGHPLNPQTHPTRGTGGPPKTTQNQPIIPSCKFFFQSGLRSNPGCSSPPVGRSAHPLSKSQPPTHPPPR